MSLRIGTLSIVLAAALSVVTTSPALAQTDREDEPSISFLSGPGPYGVASYSDFPDAPEFAAGTVYHPVGRMAPVAGVAVAPGYTEEQEDLDWLGPRLASHGYAILILDTNDLREPPEARAEALLAAVRVMRGENARPESPLYGAVDEGRMAIMGHSMGGGGTLLAAEAARSELRAAIPITPWQPEGDFAELTVPTLIIAGENDGIAPVAEHAWPHFQSIPASTPSLYVEMAGGNHFIADSNRGEDLAMVGRYILAWLKLYVDDDERYRTFLYDDGTRGDEELFSRYVARP